VFARIFGKWAGDLGELDKGLTELDELWKAWCRELLSDFGYECACSFACGDEGVKEKIRFRKFSFDSGSCLFCD